MAITAHNKQSEGKKMPAFMHACAHTDKQNDTRACWSWISLIIPFKQQIDAEGVCEMDSPELQVQILKDCLNFNKASETTITIFIRMIAGISVC